MIMVSARNAILADAQERGLVARNVAAGSCAVRRQGGTHTAAEGRQQEQAAGWDRHTQPRRDQAVACRAQFAAPQRKLAAT